MKSNLLAIVIAISFIIGPTLFNPAMAQDDLIYVAVTPCRLADTRYSLGGAIPGNTSRNFLVSGSNLSNQGGTGCIHPKAGTGQEPVAVSAYITAVPTQTSNNGYLTAYPSGESPATVATVNYTKGQVIGNTTNVTLCRLGLGCPFDGQMAIYAYTEQDVVIDVQGYFYPLSGTGDFVTTVVKTQSNGDASGSSTSEVIITTCPTGTLMTGGGVSCNSDNFNSSTTNFGVIIYSAPAGNSYVGLCAADALFHSFSKFGPPITVYAVCAASVNTATLQATSAEVATLQATSADTGTGSQPQQGEPSEEALLLLESLRNKAAEMERISNEK